MLENRCKLKQNDEWIYSFQPVVAAGARVLLLGSMPGRISLERQEYYAHPQNLFWKILAGVLNASVPQSYPEKLDLLIRNHIALWDACHSCVRKGSLDADIKDVLPNEIPALLEAYPDIRSIVFNGRKSEAVFRKHFREISGVSYYTLPSTSPANAGIPYPKKIAHWEILRTLITV